ncbi:MAG TPA: oligopeptide:H+ symporter [Gemmataceae bacterium]|nr:oligopeptide:H+ symporter [Gemmataceae bacterium]
MNQQADPGDALTSPVNNAPQEAERAPASPALALAVDETRTAPEKAGPGGLLGYFKGHPVGFWFFFWGEFAERCSYYGMRAILAMYMAEQLGLGQDNAATYMSVFIGACYFLPLIGGWIADNYLGKYWTIVGFSIPYILGHVILGIENVTCLVIALALLAMGSGVIKPNISTLMGLTYDQQRPGQTKLRSDAFAIFYFSINVGAAISQFAMPPIRSNYGYAVAFLFPAALMGVAFLIFAAGKPFYGRETVGAAERTPEERAERWRVLGRIFGLFFLIMFFWAMFDQAASTWIFFTEACMDRHIFGYEMDADQMQFFNPVLILILLPPITVLWRVLGNRGINVRPTDKMVLGFLLTFGCMGVMAFAAWRAGTAELRPGMAQAVEKDRKKQNMRLVVEGAGQRLAFDAPMRIDATSQTAVVASYTETRGEGANRTTAAVTLALTGADVLKLVPAAEGGTASDGSRTLRVEGEIQKLVRTVKLGDAEPRKETLLEGDLKASITGPMKVNERWFVAPKDQVTVWWLVLAYIVITVGEVLISVTGLELAYTAAPKSMTSFVTACWLLTVALANWLINIPVTRLYTQMQPMAYFGMLTAAMLAVSIAFIFVAQRFKRHSQAAERAGAEA